MDAGGVILTGENAAAFHECVMQHLKIYASLNGSSRNLTNKTPGRSMWLLAPKHHHFWHLGKQVLADQINPAYYTLLCAEDFVGRLGKIARVTHRSTVSWRTLQRYLALTYLA